jgi:hypothetical protein
MTKKKRPTPVAFTAGQHRNEAHFIHSRSPDNTRITIKRIPRWHRASIYN